MQPTAESDTNSGRHADAVCRTTRVRNQRLIPGFIAAFCYTSAMTTTGRRYGYGRISTGDQDIAPQVDELERAGCLRIFTDTASGSLRARPQLDEVLSVLRCGDVLIVVRLDRLGRSVRHLITIVEDLNSRGVGLVSLRAAIDTTTASARLVLHIFASLAEFERGLIIERTQAGRSRSSAKNSTPHAGCTPRRTTPSRQSPAASASAEPRSTATSPAWPQPVADQAQAFVDESGRGPHYYVCAAIIANTRVNELRRVARSLCLPGQRRWHFVSERDSRRHQIIAALGRSGHVRAFVYYGVGRDADERAGGLRLLASDLQDEQVGRVVLESRQGRDHLDRQIFIEQLHRLGGTPFTYTHQPPHADPGLWVADALAWCYSAGGPWRQTIAPMVGQARSITETRETRPLTVRRGAGSTS